MRTKRYTLIAVVLLGGGLIPAVLAQNDSSTRDSRVRNNSAASATYAEKDAVDIRPQYEAAVKKGRDGRFLLYTDGDGMKIFLSVRAGKTGELSVMDKSGQPLQYARRSESGGCYICLITNHKCIRIHCKSGR